jgi:Tfp pilus assembly protein PilO
MRIYHRVEPRDYKSAYKRFSQNNLDNYYDSQKRVEGMIEIMEGQLKEFEEIPKSISEIVKWINK